MKDYSSYLDEELVNLTLYGNIEAFGGIISRYKNMIFRVAVNIVDDYHTAEDIAQETFVDAYIQLSRLRDKKQLYPWLHGIAKRKGAFFIPSPSLLNNYRIFYLRKTTLWNLLK